MRAGVVVDQVVSFSEKYCTAASFKEGVAKPANYTGADYSPPAPTRPFRTAYRDRGQQKAEQ